MRHLTASALALTLAGAVMPAYAVVSARDDRGELIALARSAHRIVSLSPHATELLYAIGAGAEVVGRDGASDYPEDARRLPEVGRYGAFNVEAILALRPDLVVAWEGARAGPATRRLRALGIPVYASEPGRVGDIAATMRALGVLSGQARQAAVQAHAFAAAWQALRERYAVAAPLIVVPEVADDPAMTVNDQQFVASVFRACGAVNPFGASAAAVPLLSDESMLAARPAAVVVLASDAATGARWLAHWRALGLAAARLWVPSTTLGRPGPRVLTAAQALCVQLDRLRRDAKID